MRDRTGVQIEKPVPPWERPGCFRLDCEPHRGEFLRLMSFAAYILACLGLIPFISPHALPNYYFLALLAFALSLPTWVLSRRDLAEIQRGVRDPAGYEMTQQARRLSLAALILIVCGCAFRGLVSALMMGG